MTMHTKSKPNIVWDDSKVFGARADVAQVKAVRDEFRLLFGTAQKNQPDRDEMRVELLDQVVMSPIAAKRLLAQLNRIVQQYESAFGSPRDEPSSLNMPARRLPHFQQPVTNEKVSLLFQLLSDLKFRVAFERSFKASAKSLDGQRFLVGVNKHTVSRGRHKSIIEVCARLGMPEDFQSIFRENLRDANVFGFGMDEHGETCIVKAYLEFGSRYDAAMKEEPKHRNPYLSHLGFKWDAEDTTRCALTKYTCFPGFTAQNMVEKLSRDFYPAERRGPFDIVRRVIEFASAKPAESSLLYLEAKEENNPRSSFDINFYPVDLRMEDMHPFLLDIREHYSIPDNEYRVLYDSVKGLFFGHLAGGVDRKGNDFLSVYFGD